MQTVDRTLSPGESLVVVVTMLTGSDGLEVSSLTGWSFKYAVKETEDQADAEAPIVRATATASMLITGRRAVVSVPGAETAAKLQSLRGFYYHGFKARSPSGEEKILFTGRITTPWPVVQSSAAA
jgi:hypothetical protein